MGLLDDAYTKAKHIAGLLSDYYQTGAQLYFPNEGDVKARPELAKGLLQFIPGPGDAISGYDAVQSARQGNYGEASLNGIGLLPFVPAMGGMIKNGKQVALMDVLGYLSPEAHINSSRLGHGPPDYYYASSVADNFPDIRGKDFDSVVKQAEDMGLHATVYKGIDGYPKAKLIDPYTKSLLEARNSDLNKKWSNAEDVFLRYGDIPKSGKSKNHVSGDFESGVSVFNGKYLPEVNEAVAIPKYNQELGTLLHLQDRPLFLVDGKLVGYGSDGEPLLENATILKKIR